MRVTTARRIAVGYLADLLDPNMGEAVAIADPERLAIAVLDQAEDFKVLRDGRLVITWHLDNDGGDPAPAQQEPANRPPDPVDD